MNELRSLGDLSLSGKKVLFTFDLDPVGPDDHSAEQFHLKRILPSIRAIIGAGAMPILMCHFGTPNGRIEPRYSLAPIGRKLSQLLGSDVLFAPEVLGSETEALCKEFTPGRVVLLENIGFLPGEEQNDPALARRIARLADTLVCDTFDSLGKRLASTVSLPAMFKEKAGGIILTSEIENADKCFEHPRRPLLCVLGGHTFADKIDLLECAANEADKIIIGGALANTFLAAQGLQVGRSTFDRDQTGKVMGILALMARRDCKLYLPVDFMVAPSASAGDLARAVPSQEVPADLMILDIGPASITLFQEVIGNAETILWHGTMGATENEVFARGSSSIVEAISSAHGTKIAFGEATARSIHQMELAHKFDHISSGSRSFHSLLAGKTLPGLTALRA